MISTERTGSILKKPAFEAAALLSSGVAAIGAVAVAAMGSLPPGPLLAQAAVLCVGAAGSALALRKRRAAAAAGLRRIAEAAGVPQAAASEAAVIGALTHQLAAAGQHSLPAATARGCDIPMTVFGPDDRPVFLNQSFVSFARKLEHAIGHRSSNPKAKRRHLHRPGPRAGRRDGDGGL